MFVFQPWCHPLWLTEFKAPTNQLRHANVMNANDAASLSKTSFGDAKFLQAALGMGCSSVGQSIGPARRRRRFDSSVRQGIFLLVQTLLRCPYTSVCNRIRFSPCQSSVDYGNTKTPSMYRRLGSATPSQQAFPREGNPNFPWEKPHWDNTVVESI